MRRARRGSRDLYAPVAVLLPALSAGCGSVAEEPVKEPPRPVVVRKEKPEEAKQKEETLQEAIDLALRLLVERRSEDLMARFTAPDEKERALQGLTPAEYARRFALTEDEYAEMIDLFKQLRGQSPKMSDDGSTATFYVQDYPNTEPNEFVFVRIDGIWYARDR